eukprot:2097699-Alexandrium_andersonii.AAC.1
MKRSVWDVDSEEEAPEQEEACGAFAAARSCGLGSGAGVQLAEFQQPLHRGGRPRVCNTVSKVLNTVAVVQAAQVPASGSCSGGDLVAEP